jgi:hypothetical protein
MSCGPCRAFEDAYILFSNSGTIPQAPEHIPALDADLFKNFVVTIKQLINLIRALEVLVVRACYHLSLRTHHRTSDA